MLITLLFYGLSQAVFGTMGVREGEGGCWDLVLSHQGYVHAHYGNEGLNEHAVSGATGGFS